MNVRAIGAGQEESGSGTYSHVLNVDVRLMMLAEALKQFIGISGSIQRIDEFHPAAGEIVFLNVNEKKSDFHLVSFCQLILWTPSRPPPNPEVL